MKKSYKLFASLALALAVCLGASAIGSTADVKATFKFRGAHSVRTEQSSKLKSANHQVSGSVLASKKVAKVAPKEVKLPNLIGSVVQSNSGLNIGIYSITANGLSPIKTNYTMNAANGGAALDGMYICCFMDQYQGQVYGAYYRVFDMSNWSLVQQNYQADFNMMSECMTSDGNDIYGCFYKNDLSGYELGTMALTPQPQRTGTICSLSAPYIALACDAQNLYGLYGDGKLVQINKQNGTETQLANTGVVSTYLSSAAFDSKTRILYYANCTDSETALYSIDFNNNYATAKVCDLSGEVCGMHLIAPLAEDGAPAAVGDFAVEFGENGSLSGNATFTMPTKTFAGEDLSGELNYKVFASGVECAAGKAEAGAAVSVPVQVEKAGKYKFTVVITNTVGDSPASNNTTLWVGPDEPSAPIGASLQYADSKFEISWNAVTESMNNGYFDASRVTYTVTRYVNNEKDAVVAEGISALTCQDEVNAPESFTTYTYEVVASFEGVSSVGTMTNAVSLGNIVPPYKNEFNTETDMDAFTVTGGNAIWTYSNGEVVSGYDMWNDVDTWLTTKAVKLEAGKAYKFSIDAHGEDYYTDVFEVKMGNSSSELTTQIIEETTLKDGVYRTYYGDITVETTGLYYIGVHCLSAKNMGSVHVDNFTIGAPISTSAPASVENVKFTAQYDGSTAIDVSFNAPAKTIAGEALTAITKVEVFRDGNLVKTFENAQPGAALSFKDGCENTEGTYHYLIVATNSEGAGMPYEANAYAGLKLPAAPQVCNVVENKDTYGEVTVTWTPLNTDVDGDAIDPSLITYTIVDVNEQIVAEGLTAEDAKGWKHQTGVEQGTQQWAIYYVFAKNRIGLSPTNGFTQMIPVGAAYTVPFKESCPEALLSSIWMKEGLGFWGTAQSCYQPVCMPQDDDMGMFYMEPFLAKDNNLFLSGKIQLTESDNLALSFYYCGTTEDLFDLCPVVRIPSGETYYMLDEYIHSNSAGTGWQRVIVPLAAFKGQTVQVGLNVNNRSNQDYFLMDNVEVRDFSDKDVAVSDFVAPAIAPAGGNVKMTATVANMGTKAVNDVAVELYADEELVETVNVASLGLGESKDVDINTHIDVQATGSINYQVKVVCEGDTILDNNVSNVMTITVVESKLPGVTIAGETEGNTVTLTWDAPVSEGSEETVTESFEDYESFAIGKAGDFTFYDIDGDRTFGIDNNTFPNANQPMSYIVFDASQVSGVSGFAHTGNKALAAFASQSMANDDWVITPLLNGKAQTISFWCKSYLTRYGFDQFEVLVSSTGTDVKDFTRLGDVRATTGAWAKEVVDVPEGTKYVAVRCISFMLDAFLLDDFTFTKGSPSYDVLGYNIYRNGEKINTELVTDTQYVDNVAGRANYEYNVTAVYAEGESAFSNTYVMGSPTGINGTQVANISISATKGTIYVNGAQRVAIYGVDGKLYHNGIGNVAAAVHPGVYIVKADNKVSKVSVR